MIFDGFDFDSLLKVEDIDRPLIAPIDADVDELSADGGVFQNWRLSTKEIAVTVRLMRPDPTYTLDQGFEKTRRKLAGLLYRRTPCKLVLRDAPDLYELATMTDSSSIEKFVYSRTTTLNFVCPEPASYGRLQERTTSTGKLTCEVDGTYPTAPVVDIEAQGPVTITFDGAEFEITGAKKGMVTLDARNPHSFATGHKVYQDGYNIAFSIFSDFPVWEPGEHEVKCEAPFRVRWEERWL